MVKAAHRDHVLFIFGPSIESRDEILRWRARHESALIRLPIVVKLNTLRIGIEGGLVGTRDVPEALELRLNDAALGISLLDRTRQMCRDGDRCAIWLEGYWGKERSFSVVRVHRAITDEEKDRSLFVEILLEDGARADLVALIGRLGGDIPIEEKREAARSLVAAGRDAIPLLIASLDDGRIYERRDFANRMNLPNGVTVEPLVGTVTVGERTRDLLYDIITPAVATSFRGKVFSERILSIEDFPAFWAARSQKTLEEIHRELAPLVEAYWKAHGTTQIVR